MPVYCWVDSHQASRNGNLEPSAQRGWTSVPKTLSFYILLNMTELGLVLSQLNRFSNWAIKLSMTCVSIPFIYPYFKGRMQASRRIPLSSYVDKVFLLSPCPVIPMFIEIECKVIFLIGESFGRENTWTINPRENFCIPSLSLSFNWKIQAQNCLITLWVMQIFLKWISCSFVVSKQKILNSFNKF